MKLVTLRVFEEIVGVLKEVEKDSLEAKVVLSYNGKDHCLILPFSPETEVLMNALGRMLGSKVGVIRTETGWVMRRVAEPSRSV